MRQELDEAVESKVFLNGSCLYADRNDPGDEGKTRHKGMTEEINLRKNIWIGS